VDEQHQIFTGSTTTIVKGNSHCLLTSAADCGVAATIIIVSA